MDWTIIIFLFVAGIAGGVINALAGGATLITFPVMLAAGLPPIVANASNAVAISPGHLVAALADREMLPPFDNRLGLSLLVSLVGSVFGALLLLALPERLFVLPVPGLIALATLLFTFSPQIQAWAMRRRAGAPASTVWEWTILGAVSAYGGFFGAGLGVMLTAVLAITEPNDIRKIKVLKNLLASSVSLAAVAIFILQDAVRWHETAFMLVGALIGGYAGGHLIRILPGRNVRQFVIIAGTVMTVIYAARYWF
jgi:uncharacterized membrane protein YfcA